MIPSGDNASADPLQQARLHSAPPKPKRFYTAVEMAQEEGRFVLRLDGKRAMTPGRALLTVSEAKIAEAIVAEWAGQGEFIDPGAMPMTRLVNSAIDGVSVRMAEVRDSVLDYASTDLLFYRAGEPSGLVTRQREAWDPIVTWAERRFSGRFILSEGVVHVAQPESALAAIRLELANYDNPLRLAGLHLATTLSGSALIALALATGELGTEQAWAAAHVDEDWNISQWGADQEAMERRDFRLQDFRAASLALMPPGAPATG